MKEQLSQTSLKFKQDISSDSLLEEIASLFKGRIGSEIDRAELDKLLKDGKERFERKIPPGYKDSGKDDDGEHAEVTHRIHSLQKGFPLLKLEG